MLGTTYVLPDEPCCSLSELNELSPDFKRLRRYQIIHVVRNDQIAEYRKDLGPARKFKAFPFQLIGGFQDGETKKIYIEETVARMKDMADEMRHRKDERPIPVSNLLEAYANLRG